MKKSVLAILALALGFTMGFAQEQKLPAPQKSGGKNIMETLWSRGSTNEFSPRMLSDQDLSNLLFATIGVNRENGKLTSPTARNLQEIRVFVFTGKGVSEYLNKSHSLKPLAKGDHRGLVAKNQDWVKTAPVVLVTVADEKKFGNSDMPSKVIMGVDAGIVTENINMFCAGSGLVTHPRMNMDIPAIKKLLGLDDSQTPLMNNPVGYAK